MLVAGPQVMDLLFGGDFDYGAAGSCSWRSAWASTCRRRRSTRPCSRTRARRSRRPAGSVCAVAFVLFLLLVELDDRVLQVEVAFVCAAALLAGSLYALYSRA